MSRNNELSVKRINGGVYLVVDPTMALKELLPRLQAALQEGVAVVQVWDHQADDIDMDTIYREIIALCHAFNVPVLINNRWELLSRFPFDGIHFDAIPTNYSEIQSRIKDVLCGITCNNDLSVVEWASNNSFNYISFCSIFPSSTSTSCELVSLETITRARQITTLPLFLAGGINLTNLNKLVDADFDGVAVISGIMSSDDPGGTTRQYLHFLKHKELEP